MPVGKIYYNIANRTVRPLLTRVYELVNDAAIKVMEAEDRKINIGFKALKGEFPEERLKGIIDKVVELSGAETENGT